MSFNMFLITDTHLFENSLGAEGEAYEARSRTDQKCVAETGAILKEAFADLAADTTTDTIIIPGDLVYRGEYESHVSFRKMLDELKAKGKKIYVLTAPHDYGSAGDDYDSGACGFIGDKTVPVEKMPREKLREFYYDYGFSQAISEDLNTMSYVAALTDKIRVMAINVDGNCHDTKGTISDEQMVWIKEQIKDAKDNGCYIFAMMHYPLLPGSPIMSIIGDAKIKDWENRANELADAGLDLIFTGHMHMQSLTRHTSPAGNTITDICTGSIVGWPARYRKITFNDNGELNIRSLQIADFQFRDKKEGQSSEDYFKWRFDRMITDAIDGMAYNFPAFARFFGGEEKLKPVKPLVTMVGKLLQKLTLGGVGKIFWFKVDKSIKDILLKDIGVELVRNVFTGDQPYTPDTPVYQAAMKLFSRLPLGIVEKKVGAKNPMFADIKGFLGSIMGKEEKLDNNCDIKVNYDFEV